MDWKYRLAYIARHEPHASARRPDAGVSTSATIAEVLQQEQGSGSNLMVS